MKKLRTIVQALVAGLLSTALVATPARAAEKKDGEKESVLHTEMEAMGKSIKALRKSVKDPAKKEESLKHVADLKKQATLCKAEVPKVVAKAPEAEREKLKAGYIKMMDDTIAELDKCEKAIQAGNSDAAAEALKALKTLEDDGHEKYNP